MTGAALVAIAATVGNFLQGWDNATIAGAILYIKEDLQLGVAIEGLIVTTSLIGATLITTCSGAISDCIGRRPMLILSSVFYFLSGLIMLWSPNVYVLLLARLLDGFGIGLAVTLTPLYIAETAPSEIRGLLNTLPQFIGSGGMFLAYCMIFGMSLTTSPSWRLILGVISVPSLLYFALTVVYLPESPRWLVSKGRMLEAKRVLQKLRGREDVSGELALLVEGLAVGGETSIEEYIICRADELQDQDEDQELAADNTFKLYGPEDGLSWIAKPVTNQSRLSLVPRQGSRTVPLMDPLVTLFGNFHEKVSETGSMKSMLFPNLGSMFSIGDPTAPADGGNDNDGSDGDDNDGWDEENPQREGNVEEEEEEASEAGLGDTIQSPLISRQTTSLEKDMGNPQSHGTVLDMRRHSSLMRGEGGGNAGIGGGWQLAWKWTELEGENGNRFKRVYFHEEGARGPRQGSLVSIEGGDRDGEYVRAAALVCQPALYSKEHPVGPAMFHPSGTTGKESVLDALLEPGVKRALIVGVGIQILQQFSGINGVLYYTPQLFKKAGVEEVLSNLNIGPDPSYFLSGAFTNFLMLPSIAVAMRFMDATGRRPLLLRTIPILVIALIVLIIANIFNFGTMPHAVISTICIIIYSCMFAMGYGPIPNILCSEIFPTRVRGVCIAICALAFWICNVIVTYTLPLLLGSIGLAGVFGIFAVVCVVSWIFIFLRVPETKGMPLEVITEFFAVGAKQERSQ